MGLADLEREYGGKIDKPALKGLKALEADFPVGEIRQSKGLAGRI